MIEAPTFDGAIFDMDGLLIDSEPLWRRAEVEVFASVGVHLTEAMCEATTGLRIDEVVAHWRARRPWEGETIEAVAARIVERMIALVGEVGEAMPGAHAAVDACARAGLALALASSSPDRLIDATLDRLDLADRFAVRRSAQHETHGKPHPAVFLRAAGELGLPPTRCLVFEDSLNGVIAAKAARMTCVAVPEVDDPRFCIADRVLRSLEEVESVLHRTPH